MRNTITMDRGYDVVQRENTQTLSIADDIGVVMQSRREMSMSSEGRSILEETLTLEDFTLQ